MSRRSRPQRGTLWWIGAGGATAIAVLLFAALQWGYLPESWRGLGWLAFVGVPVWFLLESVSDRISSAEKGKGWRWRALAYAGFLAALVVVLWLVLSLAPPPR